MLVKLLSIFNGICCEAQILNMSIPCGITLLLTGFLARLTISFRTFLSFSPTKVTALKKEVAFVELADEQYSK